VSQMGAVLMDQLGNAAVTGAGFGFGSAVAGELVHASECKRRDLTDPPQFSRPSLPPCASPSSYTDIALVPSICIFIIPVPVTAPLHPWRRQRSHVECDHVEVIYVLSV
jgi:hypothetical protein